MMIDRDTGTKQWEKSIGFQGRSYSAGQMDFSPGWNTTIVDDVAAGTHTYKVQMKANIATGTTRCVMTGYKLVAYEL